MKRPYYSHAGIEIYHGDCREILAELFPLPSQTFIVCDPPYGLNVELLRRNQRIIGDEDCQLRDWIVALPFPKLLFGSPAVPRPDCKAVLVWDKSELTGMGDLNFPWKRTHEEIYVIGEGFASPRRKGSVLRYPLRPEWSNHPDAVTGLHPTEKPIGLMVDLLECCPWPRILDPTCGSCSTLVAAKLTNKQAIGIEISEEYCEIGAKRLSQETLQFEPVKEKPLEQMEIQD